MTNDICNMYTAMLKLMQSFQKVDAEILYFDDT